MADLTSNFLGIKSPNPFWLASAPPTDKAYNIAAYRQIPLVLGLSQRGDVIHGIEDAFDILVRHIEAVHSAKTEAEKHGVIFIA